MTIEEAFSRVGIMDVRRDGAKLVFRCLFPPRLEMAVILRPGKGEIVLDRFQSWAEYERRHKLSTIATPNFKAFILMANRLLPRGGFAAWLRQHYPFVSPQLAQRWITRAIADGTYEKCRCASTDEGMAMLANPPF